MTQLWSAAGRQEHEAAALVPLSPAAGTGAPTDLTADARVDRTVRLLSTVVLWAGLFLVTYWWAGNGGVRDLAGDWAGALTSIGRLSGLWAADLLLIQVILMSRLPVLEHAFGRDRIARIHRITGLVSFDLMALHVVTIVAGYASARWSLVLPTIWSLLTSYGGILLSVAGTACLVLVVITSLRASRRRLRYESWHLLHLYAYLGVGLALPHQLWTGQEFLTSTAATVYWRSLWAVAAAAILLYRVALPIGRSLRYQLRVASVVRESSDVVSVHLAGRDLDRLPVRAGQFINVRFLAGTGWTRANPFSLSAAPDGRGLRITAKALGDGSARLAGLVPGTRVLFEGPYGRLSSRARTQAKVVLIGAGVGITPLRSLAEGLPYTAGEALLIQRYRDEPLFAEELHGLSIERGLQVCYLPGPRHRPDSTLGPSVTIDEQVALRHWVPDLADRDVFLCGPAQWTDQTYDLLVAVGARPAQIHTETFGW